MLALESGLTKLRNHIDDKQLFAAGAKLLLAVSGGSDSLGLLCLFSKLRLQSSITLLCCHVNHGLRGEQSDRDEALVKEVCLKLNVPVICRRVQLEEGGDLENRAREARFEVLYHLLDIYNFDYIVLGHQKEDQAETILMNMFRGTGINGMAGIRIKQNRLLHPLLDFTRAELQAIVSECGFQWATDATNEDISFKRNHLRQELIPYLQANYAPDLLDKLSQLASVMEDADAYFKAQAAKRFKKRRIESEPGLISFEIKGLKKLSDTELYYFFKHCYSQTCLEEMDFFNSHFMAIKALMEGGGSAKLHLSNEVVVYREYDLISFNWGELETPDLQPQTVEEDRVWAVFGNYRFQFKNLKLLPKGYEPNEMNVVLAADDIAWPLIIRSREPGDRFIPSGMSNRKKLKDFFIDAKVPKRLRDQVPIISDGGRILWVVGYRVDERALPQASSAKLLQIIAEPLDERPKRMSRVKQKGKKE